MKPPLGWPVARHHRCAAFTLIELLTVMTIILVLAGLIISIAGPAQYNSAKARATTEIKAIETALESYKSDNGVYPSDSNNVNSGTLTSETLDAQVVFDPAQYTNSSEFLYQVLSGYTPGATTVGKSYMTFTVQQLHAAANAPATTVTTNSAYMYIIDPFGFSYGYSTIYAANLAANPGTTPTTGYNPTFDLWSTAGYASGGKSLPANMPAVPASYNALWIKNW